MSNIPIPQSGLALKLAEILPSCVTYIELNFESTPEIWHLNLKDLSLILRARCPNLQVLILRHVRLAAISTFEETEDLRELLENMRIFVLHHTGFMEHIDIHFMDPDISKMEVLDFRRCPPKFVFKFFHSMLPSLKKLCLSDCYLSEEVLAVMLQHVVRKLEVLNLENTLADSNVFRIIRKYGHHLTELYMCNTYFRDEDLIFSDTENALKNLKIICIRNCEVENCDSIISLINSCQSLQHVYIGGLHRYTEYLKLRSEKVHVAFGMELCNHWAKVNYMYE